MKRTAGSIEATTNSSEALCGVFATTCGSAEAERRIKPRSQLAPASTVGSEPRVIAVADGFVRVASQRGAVSRLSTD